MSNLSNYSYRSLTKKSLTTYLQSKSTSLVDLCHVDPDLADCYRDAVKIYNDKRTESTDAVQGGLSFVEDNGTYKVTCAMNDCKFVDNGVFSGILCRCILDADEAGKFESARPSIRRLIDSIKDYNSHPEDIASITSALPEAAYNSSSAFCPAFYAFSTLPPVGCISQYDMSSSGIAEKIGFMNDMLKDRSVADFLKGCESLDSVENQTTSYGQPDFIRADRARPIVEDGRQRLAADPNKHSTYGKKRRIDDVFAKANAEPGVNSRFERFRSNSFCEEIRASAHPKFEAFKSKAGAFFAKVAAMASAGVQMARIRRHANKVADYTAFLEDDGHVVSGIKDRLERNADPDSQVTGKGRDTKYAFSKGDALASDRSFGDDLMSAEPASTFRQKAKRCWYDAGLVFKAAYAASAADWYTRKLSKAQSKADAIQSRLDEVLKYRDMFYDKDDTFDIKRAETSDVRSENVSHTEVKVDDRQNTPVSADTVDAVSDVQPESPVDSDVVKQERNDRPDIINKITDARLDEVERSLYAELSTIAGQLELQRELIRANDENYSAKDMATKLQRLGLRLTTAGISLNEAANRFISVRSDSKPIANQPQAQVFDAEDQDKGDIEISQFSAGTPAIDAQNDATKEDAPAAQTGQSDHQPLRTKEDVASDMLTEGIDVPNDELPSAPRDIAMT